MSTISNEERDRAKWFLEKLVFTRNFPLLILGLTTIAIVHPSAKAWVENNLGMGTLQLVIVNLATMLVYGFIDGALELTLKYIDGAKPRKGRRAFFFSIVFAGCVFLGGSGTFSIWAAPLMAALTEKENDTGATKNLIASRLENQRMALESNSKALEKAIETQDARILNARKKAEALEKEAAQTSHSSWYRDYLAAKNNPSHWLWTCSGGSGCPPKYRDYRDGILAARESGSAIIAREENLVASLSSGATNTNDGATDYALIQTVKADSTMMAKAGLMFETKRKTFVAIEIICLFAVIIMTIIIQIGKAQYDIELSGDFVTLFSALEMGILKILNVLYELYKSLIDAISPQAIQNLVMVPVVAAGNIIGRKARVTREALEIAEQEKRKAEEESRRARQEAAAQKQALEEERRALEEQAENERRARELEKARAERARMEAEARERARKEQEEARKREAERDKERQRKAREDAQDKAREPKALQPVEKSVKDKMLNAIRYKWKAMKALDATKEPEKYAEYKAQINDLLADKNNGLAYLERRGYVCNFDWESGKLSAKLPK